MRHLARALGKQLSAAVLVCGAAVAAMAQTPTPQDQDRFAGAMAQSLMSVRVTANALEGDGGAWLTQGAKTADLLLIGENHGVADIAHVATVLARAQSATVYGAEVGPAAPWKLGAMLKGDGPELETYMADARRANSFAFLNMREEVAFARAVLRNGPHAEMWGLDQEFITSGPLLLERLGTLASSAAEKQAIKAARAAMEAKFFSLSRVPPRTFADLKDAFASSPAAIALIDGMALSADIYDALGYAQNAPREELMKRQFLAHWRAARDADGRRPKIVMKMGSNHLQAGLSPTMVPALGGFVRSLALSEGKSVFSVLILCGSGGAQRAFDGSAAPCDAEFKDLAGELAPHLSADGATLFRSAPLRAYPGTLKRLGFGEDLRQLIFSYDAILVLKDAKPATSFAAPEPKWLENQ